MKPSKSNKNTLKKSYAENNRKSNIFIKSTGPNYFNTIKTTNPDKRKNYLISLLGKKTPKNLNLNKFGLNYKKNNNNNSHNVKKEIYLTSGYDNYNKKKEDKSRQIPRNINIRLNLSQVKKLKQNLSEKLVIVVFQLLPTRYHALHPKNMSSIIM